MQLVERYDKSYTCSSCNKQVNYCKVANDEGKLVTKDGKEPNGKYGKESNVLSAAVDAGTNNLHPCFANLVVRDYDELTGEVKPEDKQNEGEQNSKMTIQCSDEHEKLLKEFEELEGVAYLKCYNIASRHCPNDATSKEKHITTMGLIHDFFSFLQYKRG